MQSGGRTNRILLLCAALLFSTGGAAIKLAALSGWQIASYRAIVAALFMWLVLPAARRNWTWRTFAAGAIYAVMVALYVLSNKLTTSANAILLQSTYPLYLLLLGPLFLKEKLRMVDVAIVVGVISGAAILFSGSERIVSTAPDPVRGNIVALASGFAWALTIAALRWMSKRDPGAESAASVAIAGNAIAFAACLPLAIGGPVLHPQIHAPAIAVIVWLGVFQVGLGYVCLTRSIRHVPAVEAATLLLIEPVLNPIWAWLIHGEQPSGRALTGGAIIMLAAFAGSWWQARHSVTADLTEAEPARTAQSFPQQS
jgi:drug/metabolite transporter (DMT)-like permease